ncbi:MAG TPA: T9SS type A sorting domain-containing protein, partial [Chitinophagaceae bacterium]|nr:T9SS type A sorting domain-containing protein [Chitinophagaceae bacterium]
NASGGTDHGAAAPMFLFGDGVINGVSGTNPAIPATATVNDNIPFQYDFRSIYATILEKWFCVPDTQLKSIIMSNYQSLGIINNSLCKAAPVQPTVDDTLLTNYPNPFVESTTIQFKTKGGHTLIQIIDAIGQVIKTLIDKDYPAAGSYKVAFNGYGLTNGVYYVRLQNGPTQQVKAMLKVR